MAIYTNKLQMINTSGSTETASIYSTTSESGSPYLTTYVKTTGGWSAGYISLVSTSNSRATSGRIVKSGTTYAIGKDATPAYASKSIKTAGTGTFTVPAGVTKLRVTCVGGGAGGVTYYGNSKCSSGTVASYPSSAGKTTTFGSVSASGAGYAKFTCGGYSGTCGSGENEYSCTKYHVTSITPGGGTTAGTVKIRTSSSYSGAAAVAVTNYVGTTIFSAGGGGHADGTVDDIATGSSGYKKVSTITVTPGQTISYTVGGGGSGCRNGTYTQTPGYGSDGEHVSPGTAGGILIEWGQGIQ